MMASFSSVLIKESILDSIAYGVLSSAEFAKFFSLMKKKISFICMLKSSDPNIDPCDYISLRKS